MYRKNVASQNLAFALVNASTGAALTGATVTARRSIDGAAQANATGSVSELGNGQYNLALSQADTNGNHIGILLTATNAIPVHFSLVTTAADPTDSVRLGLTALPNAAAEAAGGLYTRGTGAGQINQPANGMVDVNQVRLGGSAQSTTDLKDFADDGYDPSTNKVAGVVLVDTVTTLTGHTPQTGDSFARLGAPVGASISVDIAGVQSATNDIQARLPAALVSGRIDASVGAMAANTLTATALDATAVTEIQSGLATQASVDTIDDFLDTEIAAILADTNELQTDWANGGRLDNILDARASQASVDTIDDFLDTEIAAILADTNELQTDWADGGRLDLILDARASQASVDDLPTNAELATALAAADDAVLTAIGNLNDLSSADVTAAVPTAAANASAVLAATCTELSQAEPPDTPTVNQALMLPYMMLAQGGTMNATTGESTYRNGAGVVFAKRTLSDDGNILTEGKLVSGP